jgi:2'-5' RNA ligase
MNHTDPVQSSLFSFQATVLFEEYLLVMDPDEKVSNDVTYLKKKAAEIIGNYPGKNSLPHISIVNFSANSLNEDAVISAIRSGLKGKIRSSFVWLEDHGCFPSSGTVYIDPKPKSYFIDIIKAIYPALKLCNAIDKDRKILFYKEPHITIARGLNKGNTDKIWDVFKDKKYESKFIADALTLLRRDNENEGKYKVVAKFKL